MPAKKRRNDDCDEDCTASAAALLKASQADCDDRDGCPACGRNDGTHRARCSMPGWRPVVRDDEREAHDELDQLTMLAVEWEREEDELERIREQAVRSEPTSRPMPAEEVQVPKVIKGIKLIRHAGGGVDRPDDPSMPFKLEVVLRPPEFMNVAFVCLYGGSERIIVRGETKEVLDELAAANRFRSHPRLISFTITGPDGVVDEVKR